MPEQGQRIGELGYQPPHLARLNAIRHQYALEVAERWRPVVEPLVREGAGLRAISLALAAEGVRSRGGRTLAPRVVANLLALLGLQTGCSRVSAEQWAEGLRASVEACLAQGMSMARIAQTLDAQGARSRRGNRLTAQSVRDLLTRLQLTPAGARHG